MDHTTTSSPDIITHKHQLVKSQAIRRQLNGNHPLSVFNTWLAVKITGLIGSMWCAYVFVAIALISLPAAVSALLNGDTFTAIAWLSQSLIQLVLLPVIMVGQRVISNAQDARADADHETLTILHTINVQQLDILELLKGKS
jgi:hypothetical protein